MDQKDLEYLKKIKTNLEFIIEHTKGLSEEELNNNQILLDSMMLRIALVAEDTKYLSETFIEKHHEIPWTLIRGLRNRIIHDYGRVNISIIYETLIRDIPELNERIQSLI